MASTINGTSTGNGGLISTGDDSGILNIQTNETTAITVDASQNVGIGTASPSGKLNVSDATSSQININSSANGATRQVLFSASSNSQEAQISANNSTGELKFESGRSGTSAYFQTFYTNNSERMRIDSSGIVNIGCTSGIGYVTRLNLSVNSGTNKWCVGPYTGNATAFIISENTNFGVYLPNTSATAWSSASDERLKENLVPIENGLTKVCSLRSVIGNFIADEEKTKKPFLIAQDVQAVLPEAVTVTPSGEHLGIAYTETIPLLVAAIKELKAINDTQAETLTQQTEAINALTARIVALETA